MTCIAKKSFIKVSFNNNKDTNSSSNEVFVNISIRRMLAKKRLGISFKVEFKMTRNCKKKKAQSQRVKAFGGSEVANDVRVQISRQIQLHTPDTALTVNYYYSLARLTVFFLFVFFYFFTSFLI